jgi:hypothetical protein
MTAVHIALEELDLLAMYSWLEIRAIAKAKTCNRHEKNSEPMWNETLQVPIRVNSRMQAPVLWWSAFPGNIVFSVFGAMFNRTPIQSSVTSDELWEDI